MNHDAPPLSPTHVPAADADTELRVHLDRPTSPITVEVTRGGMVESVHRAIATVVDADGKAVMAWGDTDRLVYARSAIKPLQALPVLETGAADAFNLSEDEIALCCASHAGEAMHVDRVTRWLDRLGLSVNTLECGPQLPYNEAAAHAIIRSGEAPSRAHNNCSGKHSGMLTTAVHMGEAPRGYTTPEHPVQKRCLAVMQEMSGEDLTNTPRGVDGCGIPVFGCSLKGLATAMARLADPWKQSADRQAATKRIIAACAAHPLMLSGTDEFNSVVLAETGVHCLLKGGAEGVYAGAIPERGLGICLKVDDGAGRASKATFGAILRHLGVIDDAMAARLNKQLTPDVTNWEGRVVGRIRPAAGLSF